jgi:undecaprenyl-diphosphatase
MTILQALILGIVQGLAEMLPISSSAHLVLLPWFFHFPDPGLAFDVALHLGTLLGILLFFWKDWLKIFTDFLKLIRTRKVETFEQKLSGFLVLASIPGAVFGYLLESKAETVFRNPLLIAGTLVFMGVVLVIVDRENREKRTLNEMRTKDCLIIGLSQAIAIVPGISRSGATITTGLFAGFKREDAAKFSFLMSVPIIAGAGLLKLKDLPFSEITSMPFLVGFAAAVVSSIFAISFLLRFVRNHKFTIFAYYRFILAAIIIITLIIRR